MEHRSIADIVGEKALIAVVEVDDPASSGELARCLGDSGIAAIEITLRTPQAFASIETAVQADCIAVGAGTVLSSEDADRCADIGARFAVSPVYDEVVAQRCRSRDMPFVPAAVTPTEVFRVLRAGFTDVKVFPAEPFGGLSLVRSLAAVFPDARLMPTGGIDLDLAVEYLAHPAVTAVGGSWIAPASLIADRDWTAIGKQATAAMDALATGVAR